MKKSDSLIRSREDEEVEKEANEEIDDISDDGCSSVEGSPWLNAMFDDESSSASSTTSSKDKDYTDNSTNARNRSLQHDTHDCDSDENDCSEIEIISSHVVRPSCLGNGSIDINEKRIGGSIETMVWPSATYLSEFILGYAKDEWNKRMLLRARRRRRRCGQDGNDSTSVGLARDTALDSHDKRERADEIVTSTSDSDSDSGTQLDHQTGNAKSNSHAQYCLKEKLRKTAALEILSHLLLEFDPFIRSPPTNTIPTQTQTNYNCDNESSHKEDTNSKQQSSSISQTILKIIELGAGVGLTGIALASELRCKVLLTDIDSALPLLHSNIHLNRNKFIDSEDAVTVKPLHWGSDQWKSCLAGFTHTSTYINNSTKNGTNGNYNNGAVIDATTVQNDNDNFNNTNTNATNNKNDPQKVQNHAHDPTSTTTTTTTTKPQHPNQNILLLASDCVYFEELHASLEHTIASILSTAPTGSMCLIAGVRRWKRDNTFYSRIGKITRTKTHSLQCVCVQETVTRNDSIDKDDGDHDDLVEKREIMRIYAIQWLRRTL